MTTLFQQEILRLLTTQGELRAEQIAEQTHPPRAVNTILHSLRLLRGKTLVYQPSKRFWAVNRRQGIRR
jgi:hypothetical protein